MNYMELALREIEQKIAALTQQRDALRTAIRLGGGNVPGGRQGAAPGTRREMSPEAKQRIRDAATKRWADIRAAEAEKMAKKVAPKKSAPKKAVDNKHVPAPESIETGKAAEAE